MVDVYISWESEPERNKLEQEPYAHVSPENPHWKVLSPEENQEKMLQLYDDLIKIGIPPEHIHTSQMVDSRTGYTEHSFFIEDIEMEDAIGLADRYDQVEIMTDQGTVDVKSMELVSPIEEKITGDEALKEPIYTQVEGIGPIAYRFKPNIQGREIPNETKDSIR